MIYITDLEFDYAELEFTLNGIPFSGMAKCDDVIYYFDKGNLLQVSSYKIFFYDPGSNKTLFIR